AAGAVTLSGAVSNFDFVNITNGETSSVAGVINGSGPLTKSGAGMLSLAGTNTYTGNTIINAGTLRLSGSGSIGSGTYAGTITNNGIFRSTSSTAQTLSGVISGTGRVDASGNSGALTLTGTNTYSGGARVASGGILVAGSAGALGTEKSVRSTSTSDQFSVSSGVTLSSLRVTGAVRLNSGITTTGAQTYTSDVVVASGTRASPVEFNTTNSNITFGGTLKGEGNSKARSITIDTGTGDLEFGDRVGYAFNNENYDANNTADSFYKMTMTANDITIKGDVMTFEEQTYNGNLVVSSTGSNGTTRTLLSIDPKVTINGTVNDSTSSTHTLVAKAVAIRRDGQVAATPEIAFNGKIGTVKALAGYSGVTGYQVVTKNYGVIDDSTSFGTVTGGSQTQVVITQNNNTKSSQSNGRKTEKSANAVSKSAQTTIADAGKNLIATLFGGGPSGGGRTFSKSIEVVMPGDAGFNQPGPETGSGANIDADFSTPGNNQSAPSFEPRGNTSIGGAPAPKSQGGNFNSIDQGTSSPKPRSIRELFRSKDFKNQFSSKQEMRQFKRELRQEFKNNPGSRKSFNKALRDGFDPTDPKSFENATPEQRKVFEEFKERATPEEQEAFRKLKDGDEDPRKLLDKSKDRPDERGQGKDDNNKPDISEDDEEQKK
ncbi:MAG: autotransporter-associated beta strand repeat-containing protein, partial [Pelagibacteraceae bacterium]